MSLLKKRYEEWLKNPQIGEQIFLIAFILYLGISVWQTTMFPLPDLIRKLFKLSALPLLGIKIVLYDRYQLKQIIMLALAGMCTLFVFYFGGFSFPFVWLILIMGSKNVPFEKILKVYLTITGGIVFLAFVSSILGVIENLQYITEARGIRNSFGIIYTTDFAAHIFYLILVFFYLKRERLRSWHYAGTVIIAGLVYYFCNARLDSSCILFVAVLYGCGNAVAKSKNRRAKIAWERFWTHAGMFIMPALAAFSIVITILYQQGSTVWSTLDKLSVSRISLGKKGFTEYGVKLFGQQIEMVGGGRTTEWATDYFFLDCSYVNILLRFGMVLFAIVLGMYLYISYKNKHDLYLLYAIALIAVNCVFAHHMLEVEYNPFTLAMLATSVAKIEQCHNSNRMFAFDN